MATEDNEPKEILSTEEWKKTVQEGHIKRADINRTLMNFLVVEGCANAVQKFQLETGTKPTQEISIIRDRMTVKMAVERGDIEFAMERIQQLYPQLFDTNPKLLPQFHLQQFVELIRNNQIADAYWFAHNKPQFVYMESYLLGNGSIYDSPYADLMNLSHRLKLARNLNEAILHSQNHETQSDMTRLLKILSFMQKELNETAVYPNIVDFSTATVDFPALPNDPQ